LDTAAQASVITRSYADSLGLPMIEIAPANIVVGDGSKQQTSTATSATFRLVDGGPAQTVKFFVSKNIPVGQYALLGAPDMKGLVIDMSTRPATLSWNGICQDDEDEDASAFPDDPVWGVPHDHQQLDDPAELIQWGDALTAEQKGMLQRDVSVLKEAFSPLNDRPMHGVEPYKLTLLPGAKPFRSSPRPLNQEKLAFVKSEIDKAMKLGTIKPSTSPWAAPVHVAPKKGPEKFRLCVDYGELNKRVEKDAYPMKDPETLLQGFRGMTFKATFDASKGFNQAPVDEETQRMMAFVTPFGTFQPTRLNFGTTNGPPYYQRAMSTWISSVPNTDAYFDDIKCGGATFEEFRSTVKGLLQHCVSTNTHLA